VRYEEQGPAVSEQSERTRTSLGRRCVQVIRAALMQNHRSAPGRSQKSPPHDLAGTQKTEQRAR
jgi:hypothetical protein